MALKPLAETLTPGTVLLNSAMGVRLSFVLTDPCSRANGGRQTRVCLGRPCRPSCGIKD